MNLNDIGKIGKILKDTQEISKNKKTSPKEADFSKILEQEISQKVESKSSTSPIIPSQNLLNIKQKESESIFIKKGIENMNEMLNNLDKFKNLLSSDSFNLDEANNTIKSLQKLIGNLNSILNNISNPEVKEDLNKAILIGNVEIEKYLRGDYF